MEFLLAFALLGCCAVAEITKEEGVLVLTEANFEEAVHENEIVLVEFYAHWCGHCKALAPEYAKAAGLLAEKDSAIKLGKVDATQETKLAEKFEVRGFPTLKLFKNGKATTECGGGRRTANAIVAWLEKKTGPAARRFDDEFYENKQFDDVEAVSEFYKENGVAIIGFFKDQEGDKAKAFLEAASNTDDYRFGITSSGKLFSEHGVKGDDGIVLLKDYDEGKVAFDGAYEAEEIARFVEANARPLVMEFSRETAQKIFSDAVKNHLLLFLSKRSEEHEKVAKMFSGISKGYKGRVLFVSVDTDLEDHKKILESFGVKEDEVPGMRLNRLEGDAARYRPENGDLTEENVRAFVDDFLDGKLEPYLLSQDVPEDWDSEPVKVLVGENFEEVAMDKDKDVLVEFYAPWCGHCKRLAPTWDKLGEEFKDREDLVIAKMDSMANELEGVNIQGFPTIRLFKKDDNAVVDYNGERNFEELKRFVESVVGAGPAASEEDHDEL